MENFISDDQTQVHLMNLTMNLTMDLIIELAVNLTISLLRIKTVF